VVLSLIYSHTTHLQSYSHSVTLSQSYHSLTVIQSLSPTVTVIPLTHSHTVTQSHCQSHTTHLQSYSHSVSPSQSQSYNLLHSSYRYLTFIFGIASYSALMSERIRYFCSESLQTVRYCRSGYINTVVTCTTNPIGSFPIWIL